MQHVDVNTFQSRACRSHSTYTQTYAYLHTLAHTHTLSGNTHMPRRFKADVQIGHKNSTAKDNRSQPISFYTCRILYPSVSVSVSVFLSLWHFLQQYKCKLMAQKK